jgi:hypothetical protein
VPKAKDRNSAQLVPKTAVLEVAQAVRQVACPNLPQAVADVPRDVLFYHLRLCCFIIIDLKMREFTPEDAGKLNFYLSAVDSQLRHADDKPTIGLLLCKTLRPRDCRVRPARYQQAVSDRPPIAARGLAHVLRDDALGYDCE